MDGSVNLLEHVVDATPPVAEPEPFAPPEPTILRLIAEHQHEAVDRGVAIKCGYIYVIEAVGLKRFKIGMSVDIKGRFPSYRTECPVNCYPLFIAVVPMDGVRKIERKLHELFEHRRVKGEWFDLTPEDLAQMPDAMKKATRPHLGMITRKIHAQGRYMMHPANAKAEQAYEMRLLRQQQQDSVPTVDLVLDRMEWVINECGKVPVVADITSSIERKPQRVHEAIRFLLLSGQIAIVCPRRDQNGAPSFNSYRFNPLTFPGVSCNWEETSCGSEILAWEPLGEFVAEYYGRDLNWLERSR